jgi:hypothetical protein
MSSFARRRREFAALRRSTQFAHLTWLEARRPRDAARILAQLTRPAPIPVGSTTMKAMR